MAELQREFNKIPQEMGRHFQSITPVDTGNARRNTKFANDKIDANYPYANRLNTGWSKQAPNGMRDPTIEWVRNKLRGLI